MPWIKEKHLYPILIFLLIFIMAVRMPLDSDMWWHLRAGEETLTTGNVYRVDTFSSSRSGTDWINHSWLSQVMMALLHRVGDFPALSIWVAVTAVLSLVLVYMQMKGHPLLRGAVLILAATVSSVIWSPRPQIMSGLLLALVSYLLFVFRKTRKWPYLAGIPLIFSLWSNLHGGYVIGLLYLIAYVFGEVIEHLLIPENIDVLSWREIGMVGSSLIAGAFLVLVNPFGVEMWRIPFNTIGVETLQNLINEWSSPDFHQAYQQPFLWMLLGLLGAASISGKPIRGHRLVPIILFGWAALVARRNFGPFAIVTAPALANQLQYILADWIKRARQSLSGVERFMLSAEKNKKSFNSHGRNIINITLIGLLLIVAVLKSFQVNEPDFVSSVENNLFPVGAVEWIKENDPDGYLFNDYNWGGYLIYNLPEYPVFVDGRTDLFGDQILNDYLEVIYCKENRQMILEKYGLSLILIRSDSCMKSLAAAEGWRTLYIDEISLVLGRNTP